MLRRWGFDFVAAVVAHRKVLVVEEIEHRMVPAGHKAASVAVVAHREASVVHTGNFVMEAALHTGWVVVTVLQALFHSWCKIVGRR